MATLTETQVLELAEYLENAELNAAPVVKITDRFPDMDYDDSYAIQDAIWQRKKGRGTRLAGLKMGLTSRAKMEQMGVETPIRGFLVDYFAVPEGEPVDTSALIHPKIEAEIAFVTKAPLRGRNLSIEDVLEATDFVQPALEIIDSRYENFRFDLKSVVADNCSSSRFVLGSRIGNPRALDLPTLGVVMEKNGEVVATGAGAAVLGHPAESVAMLARMLDSVGQEIPAGTLILTGGVTAACRVVAGDTITVKYQDLGTVTVRFT
jgi:2-oxo-3-hexenedioate decarboxylase